MMSAMSDFINNQLLHLRQFVEHSHRIKLPRWFIPSIYIGGGSALLVGAPVVIFIKMEKWSILESLYFGELYFADQSELPIVLAFISLSTIGFGDMVPMIEPPDQYASFVWVKISVQSSVDLSHGSLVSN